jgi:hypothetical protein
MDEPEVRQAMIKTAHRRVAGVMWLWDPAIYMPVSVIPQELSQTPLLRRHEISRRNENQQKVWKYKYTI